MEPQRLAERPEAPAATELKRSVHNENPTTSSFKTKIQQLGLKIGQQQKYHTKKNANNLLALFSRFS